MGYYILTFSYLQTAIANTTTPNHRVCGNVYVKSFNDEKDGWYLHLHTTLKGKYKKASPTLLTYQWLEKIMAKKAYLKQHVFHHTNKT